MVLELEALRSPIAQVYWADLVGVAQEMPDEQVLGKK
jgi:hypothetical protein